VPGRPQPARGGFFARRLTKEDGRLDWAQPAGAIANRVRGLSPWPGAYCDFIGGARRVRAVIMEAVSMPAADGAPGEVLRAEPAEGILVKAGEGGVLVRRLKPSGGRAMDAADFINGYQVAPGDRFE
jgi:methionyl-tRNA formyltransferase